VSFGPMKGLWHQESGLPWTLVHRPKIFSGLYTTSLVTSCIGQ
jgi:hypothetical protein